MFISNFEIFNHLTTENNYTYRDKEDNDSDTGT